MLDEPCQSVNEIICVYADDAVDDSFVVAYLVVVFVFLGVKQLINNICIVGRHGFSDLGAGIFG